MVVDMKLDMIFGSTSDEDKILPGIKKFTKDNPGLEVYVHYASADNTPDKVDEIMYALSSRKDKNKVYISGAGMSNVLTGVVKQCSTLQDLVIGIPIEDSETMGVSSFLSTSEKPPLNPVLTVGLNNSYAALNIGQKFLRQDFNELVVYIGSENTLLLNQDLNEVFSNILEKEMGFKEYLFVDEIESIGPDDVVIHPFFSSFRATSSKELGNIDYILEKGNGIQIGVLAKEYFSCSRLGYYIYNFQGKNSTGIVTIGNYANAVQMAAQIMQDADAIQVIDEKRKEKSRKLREHRGLVVVDGEVKEFD